MIVNCYQCNIEFNMVPARIKLAKTSNYKMYCSNECRHLGKRNRITKNCAVCGKEMVVPISNKDRYTTCSLVCRRTYRSESGNSNWQGGDYSRKYRVKELSRLEYKNWRKSVFERDDYTCQFCHKRGRDLQADHIKPWKYFPELRYELSNGRTLCLKCHRTTFKELHRYKNQE